MKIKFLLFLLILLTALNTISPAQVFRKNNYEFPVLEGPYLGQNPPGDIPEVFAPGILSFGYHELSLTISPDGNEMFYAMSDKRYKLYVLVYLRSENNKWSAPEIAPFSGKYLDASPFFSLDGKRLYFCSKRPLSPGSSNPKDNDIWFVEKKGKFWGKPVNLGSPVNTGKNESNLSFSIDGTLYFKRRDGLYYSHNKNGRFAQPVKLGNGINSEHGESGPYVSPDGSYLLFQSDRPGGYGGNDLYISFIKSEGVWTEPVNLGNNINTETNDFRPRVSPDGKYLFFSSYKELNESNFRNKSYLELLNLYRNPQNGYATLFWVNTGIIEKLRK